MPAQKITPAIRAHDEIRAQLVRKRLTQKDLAKRWGVAQSTVCMRIADIYSCSLEDVLRLCKIIGLDFDVIIKIRASE